MLAYYGQRLESVEVNTTFYRTLTPETVAGWVSAVPPSFRFAVKAHRRITHNRRMPNLEGAVAAMAEVVDGFGERLGPILFQFPPTAPYDEGRIERIAALVPSHWRLAFQFRHRSWHTAAVADRVEALGAAFCHGDGESEPGPLGRGSFVYLRLRREVPRADLEQEAAALLSERGGSEFDGALRIVLTRGGRRLAATENLPPMGETVTLASVTYSPTVILTGVKSLSYAANMLASRRAAAAGYDEALLLDADGGVAEGAGENLFVVLDGVVQTNDNRHSILMGMTRDAVIEIAGDLGYPVEQRALTLEDLLVADEAFFTGTAAEVTPIAEVDGVKIGKGRPGEITREIQRAYFKATSSESKRYRKWLHFVDECSFAGAYSAMPFI